MNIDVKILNKILTNWIEQWIINIKKIIHYGQVGLFPGIQVWYNICKSINVIHQINKMKEKNYTIISIDAEKALDKIWHQFVIKKISQPCQNTRNIPDHNKDHVWQPTASTILNGYIYIKKKAFLILEQDRDVCFHISYSNSTWSLATAIRQGEQIKGTKIGKEEVKLCLFADDMILYIENPKDSTMKLLDVIN